MSAVRKGPVARNLQKWCARTRLTLAATRSPRHARSAATLCFLINASDVTSAILAWHARGQSDHTVTGGIVLSGTGPSSSPPPCTRSRAEAEARPRPPGPRCVRLAGEASSTLTAAAGGLAVMAGRRASFVLRQSRGGSALSPTAVCARTGSSRSRSMRKTWRTPGLPQTRKTAEL